MSHLTQDYKTALKGGKRLALESNQDKDSNLLIVPVIIIYLAFFVLIVMKGM